MSEILSKNFEPATSEEKWYQHWLEMGYFNSSPDKRKPYTVVIPPPNVTGVLHMGHTLNETVQDVLVRKARMSGKNACWVPGSDHASIATEAKVVQMLQNEKGISKKDISRAEFLKHAFEWKEKYGNIIYHQIKKLGCSVDWNRATFTMDDHYYKAVIKVFVELYEKGMIYRGARMIHWDPQAKTALSDEEVEYRDIEGKLYYIKYQVQSQGDDNHGFIVIATQRPETIMGDTAVCVHPDDLRYQGLKGKKIIVPLIGREIPLIYDLYVDPQFGTGALKVTPAHDLNDYNLSLKHHLPIIDTLNEDGSLSQAAEIFVGLDRFEARKKIVEALYEQGLILKVEAYPTRLGFSQRTNAIVEPKISTQWFVDMKTLAAKALEVVLSGEISIHPEERFLATYKYWLSNIKEWCISRQLWWGQRIPAWYDDAGRFVVAENEQKAREIFSNQFLISPQELRQDEDVLDTWFSSWLWPMEVFKGISEPGNSDFRYYYPTSVLVTGQDIIFFWVARMIMAGMEFKHQKPFDDVYFTGMVRDKAGRKMSKSLGNSPDLLQLIDRFGADAVRFGILIAAPAGNDLLFDESSCDQGRNFNNKLWNALKLVRVWEIKKITLAPTEHFAVDWFENRLAEVKLQVEDLYRNFRLSEALKTIYSLIWDDFCSWYLEWVKPGFELPMELFVYNKTIQFFSELMQLLHPFMPFITEEIYHLLEKRKPGEDLCILQFEESMPADPNMLKEGNFLKQVISATRDARIKNNLKPKDKIKLYVNATGNERLLLMEPVLKKQVNALAIHLVTQAEPHCISVVVGTTKLYIEAEREIDTTVQKDQLLKELSYQKGFLVSVEKKLSNERFMQNAQPEIIEIEKKKKTDAENKIRTLEESLSIL
ncbi:MAG: valine--tRNA ligase [Flavisolibacter sp.]